MSLSPTHRRPRRSARERLVLILAIVLFLCAGLAGAWFCFARPPEVADDPDILPEDHEHDPDSSGQADSDPEPARQRRNNCYTILPIRAAVDAFHWKQLEKLEEAAEQQQIAGFLTAADKGTL